MTATIRERLSIAVVFAILVTLFAASAAKADPVKEFLVTVEPPIAVDNTPTDFKVEITNLNASNPLGAVEITVPFEVNSVSNVVAPAGKTWTFDWPVEGLALNKVRLMAVTQTDRLGHLESVSVVINATTPDIETTTNDVDLVIPWTAEGRQANNFNSGGNSFFQAFDSRDETFVYRDGDGLTSSSLQTHEVLVASGTANDCSVNCSGTDTQGLVTVTVSVPGCNTGTLVVDATDLFSDDNPVSIAAFYHYLEADESCIGSPVVVDFLIDKSLNVKPGGLVFVAFYGAPIDDFDPLYVGDGNALPACKDNVVVNCVNFIKGGSAGTQAQVLMVLVPTDPGSQFN